VQSFIDCIGEAASGKHLVRKDERTYQEW
jgi:hypothetical protein